MTMSKAKRLERAMVREQTEAEKAIEEAGLQAHRKNFEDMFAKAKSVSQALERHGDRPLHELGVVERFHMVLLAMKWTPRPAPKATFLPKKAAKKTAKKASKPAAKAEGGA